MSSPNLIEMKNVFYRLLKDLFDLFFPKLCLSCHREISSDKKVICVDCELKLPLSHTHWGKNTKNRGVFISIPNIRHAFSLYFFEEDSVVEKMLYQLKYEGNQSIGRFFGRKLAGIIREGGYQFDGIVGVPLHPKRQRKRGFNQVDVIGESLGEALKIPYTGTYIKRVKNTPKLSKTKQNRGDILQHAFELTIEQKLPSRHYLLLDDIFTTGATLSACSQCILKDKNVCLSIATVALRN